MDDGEKKKVGFFFPPFFFPVFMITLQRRSFAEAGQKTTVAEEEKRFSKMADKQKEGSHVVIDEAEPCREKERMANGS